MGERRGPCIGLLTYIYMLTSGQGMLEGLLHWSWKT